MIDEQIFIGLGSNLGDRLENLRQACAKLSTKGIITQKSNVIETAPWGVETDNNFLNQVITIEKTVFTDPESLMSWILETERLIGRDRKEQAPDRVIDMDILYIGPLVRSNSPIIPHPRLHLRRFVLEPLVEIAADFMHPVFKRTQMQLLQELKRS